MRNVLVGLFDSAEQARAAHDALLGQGIRGGQIGMDTGSASGDAGVAGLISRMFSGFLPDDDPRGRTYAERVARGGGVVAIHGLDDAAEARASALLQGHGAVVEAHAPTVQGPRSRDAAPGASRVPDELAAVASVGGPQAYVLPNAPTDWGRFGRGSRASIGVATDPARPEGELTDALGLDPEADREVLQRRGHGRG